MQILIRSGYVYDPINNINGEVMDIAVKDGKIVDINELSPNERTVVIDARGKVVMPGGIDIHAHIAGPKINVARLMRPEDHYVTNTPRRGIVRSQTGRSTVTVLKTGYRYALMGYTLVCEAASPPLKTRHTHEELNDTPIVDKLAYILMDSNWIGLDYIINNDLEHLAAYAAWLLYAVKGFTIKLVDPGADVAWIYGKGMGLDLNDQIPEYGLTPSEIIYFLGKSSIMLNLPHKIHIHTNRLGIPGNYTTLLETMRIAPKYSLDSTLGMHVTHIQFTGYKGDAWSTIESAGEDIVRELDNNPNVSIDLGQVVFGATTTMTADAPFEFILYHLRMWKAIFHDIEVETATGIVPYPYRRRSLVNTVQWAIGLEVALMSRSIWRIVLSTDHPNAAPFTMYPRIIKWLMSKKARDEELKRCNQRALRRINIHSIDREYSLYDIAIITRAAPAKILGLDKFKGHLGLNADADIAIYDIDPRNFEPSRDYDKIEKAFSRTYCTIKSGEIVVMSGEVVHTPYGRTYYVNVEVDEEVMRDVVKDVQEKFRKYYSTSLLNFIIDIEELRKPCEIKVKAKL